jgi:ferric-dicitrate binding protein FerR (iron transport regulator)
MMKLSAQAAISISLAVQLSLVSAATPAIGVALSSGSIMINNAKAEGNASIFDGNTIETGAASSRLQLKNGSSVQLSTSSRGKIYQDRLVLEKGGTQVQSAKPFSVDTPFVKVSGAENSSAKVSMHGNTVQVASLTGTLNVSNASGVFVAKVAPGMALDFSPADAGASAAGSGSGSGGGSGSGSGTGSGSGKGSGKSAAMSTGGLVVAGVLVTGAVVGSAIAVGSQSNSIVQCVSPCK